ncbi:glycoside hydrolase family 125 protein [Phytomonospora endophytica]|uniref:Glycoside hydrolase family 125 protein n=1 Tax=Phytomonospora endophytica TaxID=714109 RepID=A0A841FCC7_9ACTN|nr:glycoside hydrolase family 125 protein [Phytomonospora endophytica]MBB6033444.1 hypothetical protein [Phytomonospora endophytica]GIG65037.1 glycosyl hydrolase [Phytomonospora endophytica]
MAVPGAGTIDRAGDRIAERLGDERALGIFRRAMTETLDRAVETLADGTTFVITGDIPAMWLRDSSAQLRPYLYLAGDPELAALIAGAVERQCEYIVLDPYANAFNRAPDGAGHSGDRTDMNPWVWERKYEVDSLCHPVQLAYLLWRVTGSAAHLGERFRAAAEAILRVLRTEQDHENRSPYRFERDDCPASDTLVRDGLGPVTAVTGMTWSAFRPSDDACRHGFNVPGNLFAATALGHLEEIAHEVFDDGDLAARAARLRAEISAGVAAHGVVDHPRFGRIYAYEVDGLGDANLMDDANVPSLLSLPMLGAVDAGDPVYAATRRFVLSDANPHFHAGTAAAGIGSPHTPDGHVWPIALAVEGLTAEDAAERARLIATLRDTDAGTGRMHESFHRDRPETYTREWFSWADAMYCELLLRHSGLRLDAEARR